MGIIDMDTIHACRDYSEVSKRCPEQVDLSDIKAQMLTGVKFVPDRYKWKSSDRDGQWLGMPEAGDDLLKPTLILPVIDLEDPASQGPTAREKLARQIGLAAEEFGFFQVKNHGVPKAVIDRMLSMGKEFFELPMEVKERALYVDPQKNSYYQGYRGRFQHLQERAPWVEVFGENERPVSELENLTRKIWPESNGNPSFCQCIREYSEAVCQLGRQILELVAEHLGLESDYLSKHFAEDEAFQSNWRYNYYPACPRPELTLGLGPHSDPNTLTILTQDEVGGFQLRKGDFWFDVKPAPDTLLVNVGDTLQAWTNGRLNSAMHRAVVNEQSARLSLIYFLSPPEDTFVGPHSSLIDSDHPLKVSSPAWSHRFRSSKLYKTAS